MSKGSYSSVADNATNRVREVFALLRWHLGRDSGEWGGVLLDRLNFVVTGIQKSTGLTLRDKDILDIGPGQMCYALRYFQAHGNRVTGIDTDVMAMGFSPKAYFQILRSNGPFRLAKTIGRQVLGVDRRWLKGLAKAFGPDIWKTPRVLQMDARHTTFDDASFDLVFSQSVFEHIEEPEAAVAEIVRILKPGGAMWMTIHIFSSQSGAHDPRMFAGDYDAVPRWAHLRPSVEHLVQSNAYCNRVRYADWKAIFEGHMPGVRFDTVIGDGDFLEEKRAHLAELRASGELSEYSDDELLIDELVVSWRKPG